LTAYCNHRSLKGHLGIADNYKAKGSDESTEQEEPEAAPEEKKKKKKNLKPRSN
jgi:hypothetical protein